MASYVRIELMAGTTAVLFGVLGYLLHSPTLEFFAVLAAVTAVTLVVVRVVLGQGRSR